MQQNAHSCEKECTRMSSCVGYSYGKFCHLYPSYNSGCPQGWFVHGLNYAKTADDLFAGKIGEKVSGYYCKAKKMFEEK